MPTEDFYVSDSTDWLTTPLSGLAAVEAALRCEVCKDFYTTPMLTSCNHTFCSLCIRRALGNDGRCPLCRAPEQELKLRNNSSVDDVVTAFVKARDGVLEFARRPSADKARASPRAGTREVSPKRRRRDSDQEWTASQESVERESKRTRTSSRLNKTRGAQATAEIARQEAHIPASPEPNEMEFDDGLVACPVCLTRMKEVQVYAHLDKSCPGSPQPQPQAQRKPKPTPTKQPNGFQVLSNPAPLRAPDRLPVLNYSMLKEPQLRKKLAELGISNAGSRPMLEKRHREWITIWNANCDSLHPKRKAELLRDLDVWERTQGMRAPTQSRSINLGSQIKDKDFDPAAWSSKHNDEFKDLIAAARKSKGQNRQKTEETRPFESGTSDTSTPHALPSVAASQASALPGLSSMPLSTAPVPEGSSSHGVLAMNWTQDITTPPSVYGKVVKDVTKSPASTSGEKTGVVDLTSLHYETNSERSV